MTETQRLVRKARRQSRAAAYWQQPYVTCLSVANIVAGTAQVVSDEFSPSMEQMHGHSVALVWCLYLIVGGVVALYGVGSRKSPFEGIGLLILATAQVVLALTVLGVFGFSGAVAAATSLALAAAHLARAHFLRERHFGRR